MGSGCVVATTSTASWLPLRSCRASSCWVKASRVSGLSSPTVSTTGPDSFGTACSCCAPAGSTTDSIPSTSTTASRKARLPTPARTGRSGTVTGHSERFGIFMGLKACVQRKGPKPAAPHRQAGTDRRQPGSYWAAGAGWAAGADWPPPKSTVGGLLMAASFSTENCGLGA